MKRELLNQSGVDTSGVKFVSANFLTDNWLDNLVKAGLDPRKRTFFLWEGVTYYLSREVMEETFRTIATMASGSVVVFDYATVENTKAHRRPLGLLTKAILKAVCESQTFWISSEPPVKDNVATLIEVYGLSLREHLNYGRETKGRRSFGGLVTAVVSDPKKISCEKVAAGCRSTVPGTSDRECLESWTRTSDVDSFQTLVDRYMAFVHASALRRTASAGQAAEVSRAVFLVLARRARKLPTNTVLADWLFHVTAVACRNLRQKRIGRLRWVLRWFSRKSTPTLPLDATLWIHAGPQIDRSLDRLGTNQRKAVLLCAFLNHDFASAAKVLRTSERSVQKRMGRGMKKLADRLGKRNEVGDPGALASACSTKSCAATIPEDLSSNFLQQTEANRGQQPSLELARRTLKTLTWLRWLRCVSSFGVCLAVLSGIVVYIDSRSGYSRLRAEGMLWRVRFLGWRQVQEMARPWPTNAATPLLEASALSLKCLS